jgi:hypothetical protein
MKKIIFIMIVLFTLCSCTLKYGSDQIKTPNNDGQVDNTPVEPDDSEISGSVITNKYGDFTISSTVSDSYSKSGDIITFTKPGEYTLSGSLNGSLHFDSNIGGSVTLYLNNANITSINSHGIYFMSDIGKVEIKAMENTINSITVAADSSKLFSAIESENNIEIGGSGTLNIKGLQRHAVKGSNIEVKGNVTLNIEAIKDGLHGKQVLISGGNTTISNCTDAIQAEVNNNNLKGTIKIEDGTLIITSCKRAFRASVSLTIEVIAGGNVIININNTSTVFEVPSVSYVSGTFKINGVDYK